MRLLILLATVGLAAGTLRSQLPTPTPEIRAEVVISAEGTGTRISETPASVVVIDGENIRVTAAPMLDDVLRQTVGFSTFRRTSSRSSNPTTQGVSLRGVGASGASRSVVMLDEVPLNDPFGGWVQWERVSELDVESVEVRRGGASSLYGDAGLSGAVSIIPRRPVKGNVFSAEVSAGTLGTISGGGYAAETAGRWFVDGSADLFQTHGYIAVDPAERGPIDSPAGVRSSTFMLEIGAHIGTRSTFIFRPSYFGEVRTNGTGQQTNRTHIRQLTVGSDTASDVRHRLRIGWRAWGGTQTFDQVFTSVNALRTLETPTRVQRVPAQMLGASVQLSFVAGRQTIVSGASFRSVRGSSDELAYTNGIPTGLVDSGGRERSAGVFANDVVQFGERFVLAAGIRYDVWRNYAGSTVTSNFASNTVTASLFDTRGESSLSPRLSALIHIGTRYSAFAETSRSFRAPTLNELYRSFRVGNVLTLANTALAAEHANNIEAGVMRSGRRIFLRSDIYWTKVEGPIANVTLSSTAALITRQRQNAGRAISRGAEVEAEYRREIITLSAGYMYADSRAFISLVPPAGALRVPEVPRHQLTYQVRLDPGRWSIAVQGRAATSQFDDDQNQFLLEGYSQVDLYVSRSLRKGLRAYATIENVFNDRYSVARTPIRSVSAPVSVRLGLRWN